MSVVAGTMINARVGIADDPCGFVVSDQGRQRPCCHTDVQEIKLLVFWNKASAQELGSIAFCGTQAAEHHQGRAGRDDKDPTRTGIEQNEQQPYNHAGSDREHYRSAVAAKCPFKTIHAHTHVVYSSRVSSVEAPPYLESQQPMVAATSIVC
jgi:hypothetical protein